MKKQIKKHADLFNNKNRTGMSEVINFPMNIIQSSLFHMDFCSQH